MKPETHEQQPDAAEPGAGSFLSEIRAGAAADSEQPTVLPGFSAGRAGRRLSLTNIVIVAILTISAGSLYIMRKQGQGAGMTFQVTKIDYELDKLSAARNDDQRILAELARTGPVAQVPPERIQKNPFQIESAQTGGPSSDPEQERRRLAEQERLERERILGEAGDRVGRLELNGIMGGPIPLARISGRTVRVGDTIADIFTVVAIHNDRRTVELVAQGQTFTLSLSDSGSSRTPQRRPGR
jgi:hypothetical protein